MKPMGWRFLVVADLGLAAGAAVKLVPGDGDSILRSLRPMVEIDGKRFEFTEEKAFRPEVLGATPDSILHHPAFQRVETAYRGLKFLLEYAGSAVQIEVVSAPQKDLVARFKAAVFEPEMSELRNPPLGLVLLDFDFSHQPNDLSVLSQIAQMCKVAQSPLIAGASSQFFGLKQINLLPKLQDIPQRLHDGAHAQWTQFQKSEAARWTALSVNRWLQRATYTQENGGHAESTDPSKPESWLWGRAGWLAASAIARSIAKHGHALDASGAQAGGFASLPTRPYFKSANQSTPLSTEAELPDQVVQELSRGAFLPLSGRVGSDVAMIPILVNTYRTAPGRLTVSGTLGYQMMAGRLAQFCALLMDELPPGEAGAPFLKEELTKFLGPLAQKEPQKAVVVEPVTEKDAEGKPQLLGQITVQPEARIEGMEFRFVFQLPLK